MNRHLANEAPKTESRTSENQCLSDKDNKEDLNREDHYVMTSRKNEYLEVKYLAANVHLVSGYLEIKYLAMNKHLVSGLEIKHLVMTTYLVSGYLEIEYLAVNVYLVKNEYLEAYYYVTIAYM
jgi:hypothetical protein